MLLKALGIEMALVGVCFFYCGVDFSGTSDSSSNLKKSWAQREASSKALCLVRLEISIPYLRQAASWLIFLTPNLLLASSIAQVTSAQISETVEG